MIPELDERSNEELAGSIVAKHRELCALHRSLLADVAEQDRRESWTEFGAKSEEAFLTTELGVSFRTARAWVSAAHALQWHPEVAAKYEAGMMSADQLASVVAMLEVHLPGANKPMGPFDDPSPSPDPTGADPSGTSDAPAPDPVPEPGSAGAEADPVDEVLGLADRLTPGQLAAAARRLAQRTREEAAAAHRRRHLRATFDETTGRLHLEGDLFDDAAAKVWGALIAYAKSCSKDAETGLFEPLPARFADGLAAMAGAFLAGRQQQGLRPAVFAFADASVLAGADEGWAESNFGPLAADAIRRMACNGDVTWVAEGEGNQLFMGRTRREPTWQQTAMVLRRDGGCRFGGCESKMFCDVHHIKEWVKDFGPTDVDNFFGACSRHHHLLHEGGWSVSGDVNGELIFTDPTGTIQLSSWPDQPGGGPRTRGSAPPGRAESSVPDQVTDPVGAADALLTWSEPTFDDLLSVG